MADHLAALAGLGAEAEGRIRAATDGDALRRLRTEYLGRKAGRVAAILRSLPTLDPDARRAVGQAANRVKAAIEQALVGCPLNKEDVLSRIVGVYSKHSLESPGVSPEDFTLALLPAKTPSSQ